MTRKPLAVLLALATAAPASATIKAGPADINPYYGLETRYEDNIYRVPRNQNGHAVAGGGVRGSAILSNSVGVKATAPLGMHTLSGFYDFTAEHYKTQPRANEAYNQRAELAHAYEGSKIKTKLSDSYVNTQDPAFNPNGGGVINGPLVQRERRWQNTAAGSAEYYLGETFFFGVDGSWTVNRYLNRAGGATSLANLLNTSEGTMGFKTGYQLQPKTRVYVAAHRELVHYTEGTRQDNHRDWTADLGVEGDFTEKLKGRVQAGYEYLEFDRDGANPGRDLIGRQTRVTTALDYQPLENTKTSLVASRGTTGSASTQARYLTSTGVNLGVTQQLGPKVTAGLSGGYQQDRYSQDFTIGTLTRSRRDDNYTGTARADYKFNEYAAAGAFYTHNSRFSTFSREFSFKDNISGANVRLTF